MTSAYQIPQSRFLRLSEWFSCFREGFWDLCHGGLLSSPGEVRGISLTTLFASATRGSNEQLQNKLSSEYCFYDSI
eukprot:4130355-Amphidinium_carterae.1